MAAKTKNQVEETVNSASAALSMSDFESLIRKQIVDWERDQTGFAPYFKVNDIGDCFFGKFCAIDNRDPEFPRYIVQNTSPVAIRCFRGPTEAAEEVMVQPGEFFTISQYEGLPAERYLDHSVFVKLDKITKVPKGKFYEWEVLISPEVKKQLNAIAAQEMALLRNRRTLGEGEIVGRAALPS